MSRLKYWIKERDNPQLGTYWVACGQLTKKDAMRSETSLYGFNAMHPFDTLESYESKLAELRRKKERVQG